MSAETKLLKEQDVATMTAMTLAWLQSCRHKGTGIPYVKIGRSVRYRLIDVQTWIDAHVVATGI